MQIIHRQSDGPEPKSIPIPRYKPPTRQERAIMLSERLMNKYAKNAAKKFANMTNPKK